MIGPRRDTRQDDRGVATLFVIGMATLLLVCAGLVIDGGLAINARMRAADDAEQAARIAADSIDVQLLRDGGAIRIDTQLAQDRAAQYLQGRGYSIGQYHVDPRPDGRVVVDVENTTSPILLGIIAVDDFKVKARAEAVPETYQPQPPPPGGP